MKTTTTTTGNLQTLEAVIEKNIAEMKRAWRKVADALREINVSKLYQPQYVTWDKYCRERWGFSGSWGYELISVLEVDANLVSSKADILPLRPSQMAPLVGLSPSDQPAAWGAAAEAAEAAGRTQPTAAEVDDYAERLKGRREELAGKTTTEKIRAIKEDEGREQRSARARERDKRLRDFRGLMGRATLIAAWFVDVADDVEKDLDRAVRRLEGSAEGMEDAA